MYMYFHYVHCTCTTYCILSLLLPFHKVLSEAAILSERMGNEFLKGPEIMDHFCLFTKVALMTGHS